MNKAVEIVCAYITAFPEEIEINQPLKKEDIVEVWHCYILGNEKWLVAVLPTNNYFEITYNKETGDYYIDRYEKADHKILWD